MSAWSGLGPGLLVLVALVAVDVAVGSGVIVPSAFVVAPLIAALSGGRAATAFVGCLAVVCAALSGAWNANFGESQYWAVVTLMLGGTLLSALAAQSIGARLRLTLANADLSSDLKRSERERIEIAEILQQSLRPPPMPEIPGWSTAALYLPAGDNNRVGGDFYDAFRIEGGWMLVVGDVTGRGARAAAITAQARYTLRTAAGITTDPLAALSSLNEALLGRPDAALCTLAAFTISEDPGQPLRLVVAGHPSPLLVNGQRVAEVGESGPVLGAFDAASWPLESIVVPPGARLVVITDGVVEASSQNGRFGEERLHSVVASATSPEEIVNEVEAALHGFAGGPPDDDAAILAIAPDHR